MYYNTSPLVFTILVINMNKLTQVSMIAVGLFIVEASSAQAPIFPPAQAIPYTQPQTYRAPSYYTQPQYNQPNAYYNNGQMPQYPQAAPPVPATLKAPFREYSGYLG